MIRSDLEQYTLPDAPGVYFFLGAQQNILYIGKATSLRNRVRSYFTPDLKEKRSELIEQMVSDAASIEWTTTDSVLEALILETNLIRTHKPKYNTRSKDDKSYNHLIITNETWPRVLVVRAKDMTERFDERDIKYHFGPFPSGQLFREALKIVRRIFKFYDTKQPIGQERSRVARGQIDFNRQIGLYPSEESRQEYLRTIRHLRLFFEGKKQKLLRELERDMHQAARAERFEDANGIKKQIHALTHINDVALIKADSTIFRDGRTTRIEAYDVAHLGGTDMVGVMTVVENEAAQPSEYRKFKIRSVGTSNDPAALREVLTRRLAHPEWPYPQIIVVDGGTAQKNAAELVLRQQGFTIPVAAVVKDERHRPQRLIAERSLRARFDSALLLANAEAHRFAVTYHRHRRSRHLARKRR
jgi:excinuclease ABC subunit C